MRESTPDDATVIVVPLTVDALCVTKVVGNDHFRRQSLAFKSHWRDPEPRPMDTVSKFGTHEREQGVYLHWHLPPALAKGRVDLTKGREAPLWYPGVPNRWIILRYHHPRGTGPDVPPQVAGWLVHSDFLCDKPASSGGGTSRVGPRSWLGRSESLTEEPTAPAPATALKPLTVLGPGLPAFAAFQPYCADVFSFHDPLCDSAGSPAALPAADLSYLVAGWHTDAADDPVDPRQIDALLSFFAGSVPAAARSREALRHLGWEITPEPGFAGGERSLYHGIVPALSWDKDARIAPESGKPDGHQDIKLAVGHDMGHAMAALVTDSLPTPPDADAGADGGVDRGASSDFHAFHTGHLASLDAAVTPEAEDELLHTATHQDWFAPARGGTWWKLTRTDTDTKPERPGEAEPPPYPRAELAALNSAQRALDDATDRVDSLTIRVSDLCWLQGLYGEAVDKPDFDIDTCNAELDPDRPESTVARLAATAQAPTLRSTRDSLRDTLRGSLPEGWDLSQGPHDPYHATNDPTLLIRGAGTPLADSPATTGTALPCRYPGDALTTASVDAAHAGASPAWTATAPDSPPVPPRWDTAVADLPASMRAALTALARELYTLHALSHYLREAGDLAVGTRLSANARVSAPAEERWPITDTVWEQPWRPLSLAWKIACHPLPFEDADGRPLWDFDGSRRRLRSTPTGDPFELQGRSLISAVPVKTLQRRIDAYRSTYPDTPDTFDEFRRLAGTWNLASQRLTGLRAALLHRSAGYHLDPLPPFLPQAAGYAPDPERGTYQPIPAAQFRLRELNVVDTFGRAVMVVDSSNEGNYPLIRPDGMTPRHPVPGEEGARLVELTPRLPQPARLCVTPLSYTAATTDLDHVVDTDSDPLLIADTPVAGWLVTRRTGVGAHPAAHWVLAVYDPQGRALGEVRHLAGPAADGSRDAVTWLPLPDSPRPTPQSLYDDAFTAAHPALAGFLQALVDLDPDAIAAGTRPGTERPGRLIDLAHTVDTTLMSTAHRPGPTPIGAGLAAGRALALVRLRVHLELAGDPRTDPHWDRVFASADQSDPHRVDRRWPVRIGAGGDRDDGVIGYFTAADPVPAQPGSTDYTLLHAVHPPTRPIGRYTTPIHDGSDVTVPARPAALTVDPRDAAYLTALVDPNATITAHTDILPVVRRRVPPAAVAEHLSRLTLAVSIAPVLVRTLPADTRPPHTQALPQLTLPTPDAAGDWHFATPPRPGAAQADTAAWDHYTLAAGTGQARLQNTAPDARSGYLTLTQKQSGASPEDR